MELEIGLVVRYIVAISNSGKITSVGADVISINEDGTAQLQIHNGGGHIVIATSVGLDWIIPEYDE